MPEREQLLDTEARRRLTAPLERAWTLPPAAYVDDRVFQAEAAHIFKRDWVCVARCDQLPDPGDYLCVDLIDQPIVVARDMEGQLHAMSAICLHRAMPLAEGRGNSTRLLCPYHHWTYELNGKLRSAPMMDGVEGFVPDNCSLPKLSLEEWHGFIFVNMDANAQPLAPQLTGLETLTKDYEFENLVVLETIEFDSPWNWKILVENFMEAYHHIGPHKNTFEPVYPARQSSVPDNEGAPWSFLRMPGIPHSEGQISSFPNLPDERRDELFAAVAYPTFLFAASNESGAWYQLEPRAHDQMRLRIHALIHKDLAPHIDAATRESIRATFTTIHTEDISVNQGPWRGLQAPMTGQGRLSLYEKAIWQLNQYWTKRLGL